MLRTVLALGVLAGCAAPPALVEAPAPPASSASTVSLAALDPVRQPDLPAPLRPDPDASHEMRGHGMMSHGAALAPHSAHASSTPLAATLEAYLSVHAALASDAVAGVPNAAHALAVAFDQAIQEAPADDPHVWHRRSVETGAVQKAAVELAAAEDLSAARAAFGRLSAPFASLVEAVGAPADYDLVRQTCGMQPDAPEGGVWLQRAGEVRNPYAGEAMRMCSRESTPVGDGHPVTSHDAMGHTAHPEGR